MILVSRARVLALRAEATFLGLGSIQRTQPRDKQGQWTSGGGGVSGNAALAAAPLRVIVTKVDPVLGRISSGPGPGMTPEEARTLASYRHAGFVKVNAGLRKTDGEVPPGPAGKIVTNIDSAMSRSQLTSDVSVQRGIGNGPAMFGDHWQGNLTGTTFIDHGFVSTTTDHRIAGEFAQRPGIPDGRGATATISVPAGTSAIQLSAKGPFQEAELLLDRGLTYEVTSDTGPGASRQIEMVVRS